MGWCVHPLQTRRSRPEPAFSMLTPKWKNVPADIKRGELIRLFEVPKWENVFVLGCFARAVTIYSQQVRALNLIDALVKEGRLTRRSKVAVVGGGIGGLSAAGAAAVRGAHKVVVFERASELMPVQRDAPSRFVHPRIYEWPWVPFGEDEAGLPILNWKADEANAVVSQIDEAWGRLTRLPHIGQRIEVRKSCGKIRLRERTCTLVVEGKEHAFDLVILAVGFGSDRVHHTPGYWEFRAKDYAKDLDKDWWISGVGDGGLTDLMWRCLQEFRHEKVLREINGFLDDTDRKTLCEVGGLDSSSSVAVGSAVTAEQAFRAIARKVLERAKPDWNGTGVRSVTLVGPTESLYGRGSSVLNRLVVACLQERKLFNFVPGKLENEVGVRKGRVWFRLEGESRERVCDHLIRRYGPKSALAASFPEIDAACHTLKSEWKGLTVADDITRHPCYQDDDFLRGVASDEARWPLIRANDNPDVEIGCIVIKSRASAHDAWEKRVKIALGELSQSGREVYFPSRSLLKTPYCVEASECFRDPENPEVYEWTVRALCDCEIAVFDLTGADSEALVLLGIRAAVRRGITVTVRQPNRTWADLPFNIVSLNPIAIGDSFAEDLRQAFERGFAALRAQPHAYLDLPAFDGLRRSSERAGAAALDYDVLLLCWFAPAYRKVAGDLKEAIATTESLRSPTGRKVRVTTMVDSRSPQLTTQRLYAAIRESNLCLVDWTGWRANVFFELGVRLAVHEIDPVQMICSNKPRTWPGKKSSWPKGAKGGDELQKFFQPVKFGPDTIENVTERIKLWRELDTSFPAQMAFPAEAALSVGRTFRIVQQCIGRRRGEGEPGLLPPDESLLIEAALLAGPAGHEGGGPPPVLYADALGSLARQTACENLFAAWYYLSARFPEVADVAAAESAEINALREKLIGIANQLEARMASVSIPAGDRRADLCREILRQRDALKKNLPSRRPPIDEEARQVKQRALEQRNRKDFRGAVKTLEEMLGRLDRLLEPAWEKRGNPPTAAERVVALQRLHLGGTLGGVYRRWKKLRKAAEAYAAAARYESELAFGIHESYASTQHLVVSCLADPELLAQAMSEPAAEIAGKLLKLYERVSEQIRGPRRRDVYAEADRAVICVILGRSEWRTRIKAFRRLADARGDKYAENVTFEVLCELANKARPRIRPNHPAHLHWQEVIEAIPASVK